MAAILYANNGKINAAAVWVSTLLIIRDEDVTTASSPPSPPPEQYVDTSSSTGTKVRDVVVSDASTCGSRPRRDDTGLGRIPLFDE